MQSKADPHDAQIGSGLRVFLLSWPGFEESTLEIERSISALKFPVSVLYNPATESERLPHKRWKTFPAESRFGSKFEYAITTFRPEVYLFIASDTTTESWASLVAACENAFRTDPSIGVWTPRIDNSYWNLKVSQIGSPQPVEPLVDVISTDSIVWGISRTIRDELAELDYTNSVFGWGIDVVCAAFARIRGLRVVCDTSVSVDHRKTTTYSIPVADIESHTFYGQLAIPVDSMRRIIEQYAEFRYRLTATSKLRKLVRKVKEMVDWAYAKMLVTRGQE